MPSTVLSGGVMNFSSFSKMALIELDFLNYLF